jgi:hypothetical protein
VEGLTDGDLWRLDIFEGSEYSREKVKVRIIADASKQRQYENQEQQEEGKETEIEAETYVWTAGSHRLDPKEWDFDEFVREKMKRWVGSDAADMDEGFRDVDEAVKQDPTGGRGVNGDISKILEDKEVLNSAA